MRATREIFSDLHCVHPTRHKPGEWVCKWCGRTWPSLPARTDRRGCPRAPCRWCGQKVDHLPDCRTLG